MNSTKSISKDCNNRMWNYGLDELEIRIISFYIG